MTEESPPAPVTDAELIEHLASARAVACPECGQTVPPQAGGQCRACGAPLHLRVWTTASGAGELEDTDRAVMATLLSERGGRCGACGYDLAGLRSTTCPECGGALVLVVWSSGVGIAVWLVTLLIVLSAAATVGAWSLFQSLSLIVINDVAGVLGCFVLLVVNGALTAASIQTMLTRRAFCRRPKSEQVRTMLTAIILTLIGVVIATVAFRLA